MVASVVGKDFHGDGLEEVATLVDFADVLVAQPGAVMDGRLVLAAGPVAGRRVRRAMGSKMPSGKWETSRISCDGVCVNLSTPSRKRASKLGTERRRTRQLEVKMTDDDLTCGCRKRRSRSNPSGRAATPRRICWRKTGGIRQRRRATCS